MDFLPVVKVMKSRDYEFGMGLWLALSMSRLVGVTPLSTSRSHLWTCVYYAHGIYRFLQYFGLNVLAVSILLVDSIKDVKNIRRFVAVEEPRMEFFLWMFHVGLTIIIADVGAWTGARRLTRIQKLSSLMNKLNFRIHHRKKWREGKRILVSSLMLSLMIYGQLVHTLHYMNMTKTGDREVLAFYLHGSYQMLYIAVVVLMVEFVFLLFTFPAAMDSLYEELQRLCNNFNMTRPLTSIEEDSIRRIGTAYVSIADILVEFNKTDGSVLLLFFAYFYEYLTFALYRIIEHTLNFENNEKSMMEIRLPISGSLITVGAIAGFIQPGYQFQRKVEKMRVLTADLIYRCTAVGGSCNVTLRVFCNQITAKKPAFEALGIFTITRSLLGKVISVVFTSMVFMIQAQIRKL